MDLIHGQDLRKELRRRGTYSPAEAAAVVGSILEGLKAVHDAGVIHRDLKPENILLAGQSPAQTPLISDFGISGLIGSTPRTHRTGAIGTPEYMAPELFEDEPASPASDLYAIGVLFYELVCGVPPFQAQNAMALMRKHTSLAPGRPDGIPDVLWSFISSLLAKVSADRPTTADMAAQGLAAITPMLSGLTAADPLSEPPPSPTVIRLLDTRLDNHKQRKWRRVLTASAGVVAVAAAGSAFALSSGDGEVGSRVLPLPTATRTSNSATTTTATQSPADTASSSVGPETPTVTGTPAALPNVTGELIADAKEELRALGIGDPQEESVYGSGKPDGIVLNQYPKAGQPPGSRVTLSVARADSGVFLSDLPSVGENQPDTGPVDVGGKRYAHPITGEVCGEYYEEDPVWEYDLGRSYGRLTGIIGLDDDSSSRASAQVETYADNRLVDKQVVSLGKTAKLRVDATDVLRLQIVVTSLGCGDTDVESRVALGDARLTYSSPS
jgi:hypothetical protein